MNALDTYFEMRRSVFAYFGYEENWRAIPLDDQRSRFWRLYGEGYGGKVRDADTRKILDETDGEYYEHDIYTQRYLSKWVYRGGLYTMVCVDTRVDGNKFLMIFD